MLCLLFIFKNVSQTLKTESSQDSQEVENNFISSPQIEKQGEMTFSKYTLGLILTWGLEFRPVCSWAQMTALLGRQVLPAISGKKTMYKH